MLYRTIRGKLASNYIIDDDGKFYGLRQSYFGCKGDGFFIVTPNGYNWNIVKAMFLKE